MRLCIVHDYLNQYGGAERVLEAFHEIFSDAPIYTSIYFPEMLSEKLRNLNVKTSFMQNLPFIKKYFKRYFLLYPLAFKTFGLSEYDIVLSSSSAYAKNISVSQNVLNICYCHTPARFIWRYESYMEKEEIPFIFKKIIYYITQMLKSWDVNGSKNVHHFIANSRNIKERIKQVYNRDSEVIYPPVEVSRFHTSDRIDDYFLVVSRLNAYKKIDLAIKAFNYLKLPLRIIGDGPHRRHLEKISSHNIKFLGKVDEKTLIQNYSHCQALIFPGEEDFGLAPVEAQASGRPVIAYMAGGAVESVIEGETGLFFRRQTVEGLLEAVNIFNKIKNKFDPVKIRNNALKFDKEVFKIKIKNYIEKKYSEFKNKKLCLIC